jgi:hypothetical protein
MKLSNPPDPKTHFESPPWQTWLYTMFKLNNQGSFTVATLPVNTANSPSNVIDGQSAYVSNGRKVGETAGNGTGVPVYYSNGFWRVYSTDAPVSV